jgi:hypothetical protein
MKTEVRFGGDVMIYDREVYRSYKDAIEDNRLAHNLPDTWHVATIRAEDDRIIIVCEDSADPFWFTEKLNPRLKLSLDRIYQAAVRVRPGTWGNHHAFNAPVPTFQPASSMLTPSRAASGKFVTCHVVLQVRPTGDLYDLGEIAVFDEAVPAAMQRGEIPESWGVAVTDVNPARVIVAIHLNHSI